MSVRVASPRSQKLLTHFISFHCTFVYFLSIRMAERVARRHRTEDAEAEAAVVPGAIMPGAALAADAGIEVDATCHAALAASNSRYISGTKAEEANEIFERVAKTFPVPPQAFEANPEAKEALLKFIAACRARKSRFMLKCVSQGS
jgi:hypothetical protein